MLMVAQASLPVSDGNAVNAFALDQVEVVMNYNVNKGGNVVRGVRVGDKGWVRKTSVFFYHYCGVQHRINIIVKMP